MEDVQSKTDVAIYPEFIRDLPQADVSFPGVNAFLANGAPVQVGFFVIEPMGEVKPHSHGAQWGIVVDGELELTIGDETKVYRKGEFYYIPEGVVHSAKISKRLHVIDVFADRDRYGVK